MKNKNKYSKPKVDSIVFNYDDIIATSVCDRNKCTTVEFGNLFNQMFGKG